MRQEDWRKTAVKKVVERGHSLVLTNPPEGATGSTKTGGVGSRSRVNDKGLWLPGDVDEHRSIVSELSAV